MKKIFVDFEWHITDKEFWLDKYHGEFEIIQFGAIKLDENNNEIASFNSFVRPEMVSKMSNRIKDLTHIDEEDLINADIFIDVLNRFLLWCDKDYEIYSWSDSDIEQIINELDRKEIENNSLMDYMFDHWLDFQEIFEEEIGFISKLSLEKSLDIVGITSEGLAHDALVDARNTARLYIYMQNHKEDTIRKIKEVMSPNKKTTLGDLFDFSKINKE